MRPTLPEAIMIWTEKNFNPKYWDVTFKDFLDTATGNKEGNKFEKEAVQIIFRLREEGKFDGLTPKNNLFNI